MAASELNSTNAIHIGTWRDSCASHGCPGCPAPEGFEVRDTLSRIGRFVEENSNNISNALANQSRRMGESADLADKEGAFAYAKAFREDSGKSEKVLAELAELLEELAEARQEDFANQD